MCCALGPCAPSRPVFAAQVGAFKDRARADALAAKLSSRYQQTILVAPVTVKDQTFYRVRFLAETKVDAKTLAATLRQNDNQLACVVVPSPKAITGTIAPTIVFASFSFSRGVGASAPIKGRQ